MTEEAKKQAEAKAKADADKTAEEEAKKQAEKEEKDRKLSLQSDKKKAKAQREKLKKERSYVPPAKTGKQFHVQMEQLITKKLKKISNSYVQIMEFKDFLLWLKNAGALGYAFSLVHDPSVFYSEAQKGQIKESLKEYIKRIPVDTLEYGVENLIDQEGYVNGLIQYMYKKRLAKIEETKAKISRKDDWLD